jgi:hypothetical protein
MPDLGLQATPSDNSKAIMDGCIFCGSTDLNEEHVIPQWVYRCISPKNGGRIMLQSGRFAEGEGYTDLEDRRSLDIKAKIVCVKCNGVWMSKMENKVKRLLEPLTGETFPRLEGEYLKALVPKNMILARWMLKTAITTAHVLPKVHPIRVLMMKFAEAVKCAQVPKGIWVEAAKSGDCYVGASLTDRFFIRNGSSPLAPMKNYSGLSFQFCLQINHLLLRVALTPEAKAGYPIVKTPPSAFLEHPDYSYKRIPFRLYPTPHPEPAENLSFLHLKDFATSVFLETWSGCEGEVPGAIKVPITGS